MRLVVVVDFVNCLTDQLLFFFLLFLLLLLMTTNCKAAFFWKHKSLAAKKGKATEEGGQDCLPVYYLRSTKNQLTVPLLVTCCCCWQFQLLLDSTLQQRFTFTCAIKVAKSRTQIEINEKKSARFLSNEIKKFYCFCLLNQANLGDIDICTKLCWKCRIYKPQFFSILFSHIQTVAKQCKCACIQLQTLSLEHLANNHICC